MTYSAVALIYADRAAAIAALSPLGLVQDGQIMPTAYIDGARVDVVIASGTGEKWVETGDVRMEQGRPVPAFRKLPGFHLTVLSQGRALDFGRAAVTDALPAFAPIASAMPSAASESPDPPLAASVPAQVSPLQARRALSALGLREQVEAWVETQARDVRDAWEFAGEIRRDDPVLASAAAAFGVSDAQVDDLFRLAASL